MCQVLHWPKRCLYRCTYILYMYKFQAVFQPWLQSVYVLKFVADGSDHCLTVEIEYETELNMHACNSHCQIRSESVFKHQKRNNGWRTLCSHSRLSNIWYIWIVTSSECQTHSSKIPSLYISLEDWLSQTLNQNLLHTSWNILWATMQLQQLDAALLSALSLHHSLLWKLRIARQQPYCDCIVINTHAWASIASMISFLQIKCCTHTKVLIIICILQVNAITQLFPPNLRSLTLYCWISLHSAPVAIDA